MKNMVNIEGGSFVMGCEKNYCDIDEKPLHNVKLRSFKMSKYEVTQAQWRSITATLPQIYTKGYIKVCENCPVGGVTWNDVQDFLIKLNKKTGKKFRLPKEAEWEYAARGGNKSNGYLYSGSNYLDSVAWYDGNSNMNKSVGLKKPNELGLYDMTGNVMEWCSDWYGAYYSKNQVSNTQDPVGRQYRVIRGGENKSHSILDYRITYRQNDRPDNASYGYGFRIAHDLN
jgi:formylglycine-generating enzyme required for sulfatase activity